jgi:hypothetical protein
MPQRADGVGRQKSANKLAAVSPSPAGRGGTGEGKGVSRQLSFDSHGPENLYVVLRGSLYIVVRYVTASLGATQSQERCIGMHPTKVTSERRHVSAIEQQDPPSESPREAGSRRVFFSFPSCDDKRKCPVYQPKRGLWTIRERASSSW